MTDTFRNMPRYIRNTDAFGWQGADGPDGPWRSINPPQSGTPWQTTSAMDDLRQASADVSGVDVLRDAALNVWCAFCGIVEDHGPPRLALAAALRAAADQVVPEEPLYGGDQRWMFERDARQACRKKFLTLAAELEGNHTSEND